jgi:hypothetical protein
MRAWTGSLSGSIAYGCWPRERVQEEIEPAYGMPWDSEAGPELSYGGGASAQPPTSTIYVECSTPDGLSREARHAGIIVASPAIATTTTMAADSINGSDARIM